MLFRRRPQFGGSRSRVLLGILCIALILTGAAIHAVHTHPDGTIHPDCALCLNAHLVLATVTVLVLLLFSRVSNPAPFEVAETFHFFPAHFVLYNRPPPDSAVSR
jgi:hypothetical protein